ncbi:SRPBCC domain-containing protein [Hydrogenophaga sp.]|uniref:SRPBCC domain-containing protein n=1 Tax=Hydrogenophaga sp. TaxID=1904254 RepID=UPI00286E79C6|nr:SRPBCC domain-containing protein [Hydrogenophaga sp.]
MKIIVSTVIAAPIAEVWRLYNSPEDIKVWNTASPDWHTTASSVDLRVGGTFSSRMEAKDGSFGFDFAGVYTKVEAPTLIEYRFGDRVGQVEFSAGPTGVTVKVTFDAEDTHSEDQQRGGWQAILDNFGRHVLASRENSKNPD